ncbi:hypothetical protein Tco_0532205 [Tanacetum coccineum]
MQSLIKDASRRRLPQSFNVSSLEKERGIRLQSAMLMLWKGVNVPNVSLGGDTRKAIINQEDTRAKQNHLWLQSGHVNVMEGVNVPNVSLGGDTRKASLTRKTQGQNNTICGRVMRSRSQRQQTSGMGKSSRPPKSASYNLTGSSAQQSGVTEEVNVLNFSLGSYYASKTSITERTQGCTKAKPTDFRSGSPKESALGVVNLENGEPVVENGPTDAPVEVQPSDETCSPLSKKRKMDGFESASSVDHKSISTFFERQSLIANVVSSSPKAADTLSDNHFDERINYETTNLGLETDENLVGGDFSI